MPCTSRSSSWCTLSRPARSLTRGATGLRGGDVGRACSALGATEGGEAVGLTASQQGMHEARRHGEASTAPLPCPADGPQAL